MKYILKLKKVLTVVFLNSILFGAIPHIVADQSNPQAESQVDQEEIFLRKSIHSILHYLRLVQQGKHNFFDLSNEQSYAHHVSQFKKSLTLIKKLVPFIAKEAKDTAKHSDAQYTQKVKTLYQMAQKLLRMQDKWVQAVDKNRNTIQLGLALSSMQDEATKIKKEVTEKLVPALEDHMSDHALVDEVEEIKHLVGLIFSSVDPVTNEKYGMNHLMHRFRAG